MTNSKLISLRGVSKSFAGQPAVDDVTLDIGAGEFFSIIGPSGCGKTTLLRMLAGFEVPDSGSIDIGGVCVNEVPPHKRNVNMVFQSYALFPHLSVSQNVAFGLRLKGLPQAETKNRVENALSMVRLMGFGDRRIHQLSGGQQQRVALARALANEPLVVLLDEPLAALDLRLRREMQFELKALQRSLGTTFVFVTHDQEEAMAMSDRIAVMHGSRLYQVGTPAEIYHAPQNRVVAQFVGETSVIVGTVVSAGTTHCEVSVAGKVFSARWISRPPEVKTKVECHFRPESARIVGVADSPLRAEIRAKTFLGKDRQYNVRVEDGTEIKLLDDSFANELDVGCTIGIDFFPNALWICGS